MRDKKRVCYVVGGGGSGVIGKLPARGLQLMMMVICMINQLAEACLAQSLTDRCETAAYFHLVALSCRLRGDVESALCLLQAGITKYGEVIPRA